MYVARIRFGRPRNRDRDAADPAAHEYLMALRRNGQILEYLLSDAGSHFQACIGLPRPEALEPRFSSRWVSKALKTAVTVFGRRPGIERLGAWRKPAFPSWKRAISLYLYPYTFDRSSPVRSQELEAPIPLYLLPLEVSEREAIHYWAESYRHHDHVWLASGALEIPAYRELADPKSELAKAGRDHCRRIEAATGKPTYYYLTRYYGRLASEEDRPCPLCGRRWAVRHRQDDLSSFGRFDFCCKRCRLVSNVACDFIDERHARIGEFKKRG